PMTQFDAMAMPMWDVFQRKSDLTPYASKPAQVTLDDLNPPRKELRGKELHWAERSQGIDFGRVDEADEDTLNRILWHAMKGVDAPYPEESTNARRKEKRH
ncbi:MAG TPA: hypothetical protein VGX03_39270, partial [Candidatus Binatia bacterium]|nr:hypothetical protein [Candidatus Binatia bacterium]